MQEREHRKIKENFLNFFPEVLKSEIIHTLSGIRGGFSRLCEIRLRAYGRCSLVLDDGTLPLFSTLGEDGLSCIYASLVGDSLYAFRDTVINGYIPLSYGVRVGIAGRCICDGGKTVGVTEISSLVFRFPGGSCQLGYEIADAFLSSCPSGMLIFSAPGVGKTTALRALAAILGGKDIGLRVAVIDQRLEFIPEDYIGCEVDILRGYSRREGIEIATRTLSPQVILADEIGFSDGESIRQAISCGVPVISTVHAGSIDEAQSRLGRLGIEPELFQLAVGISSTKGVRSAKIYPLEKKFSGELIECGS